MCCLTVPATRNRFSNRLCLHWGSVFLEYSRSPSEKIDCDDHNQTVACIGSEPLAPIPPNGTRLAMAVASAEIDGLRFSDPYCLR